MSITALPKGTAASGPKALVTCDTCHTEATITVDYQRRTNNKGAPIWDVDFGQASKKLTAQGWTVTKGGKRTICPSCTALNKAKHRLEKPDDVDHFARIGVPADGRNVHMVIEAIRLHPEERRRIVELLETGTYSAACEAAQIMANVLKTTTAYLHPSGEQILFHPDWEEPEPTEETTMNQKTTEPTPIRQPTREQRQQIMELLGDVYDTKVGRYRGAETDVTVAETLGGGVMPGWVADLRELFFGDSGENEESEKLGFDIAGLIAQYDERVAQGEKLLSEIARWIATLKTDRSQLVSLQGRAEAMKKALGPRGKAI